MAGATAASIAQNATASTAQTLRLMESVLIRRALCSTSSRPMLWRKPRRAMSLQPLRGRYLKIQKWSMFRTSSSFLRRPLGNLAIQSTCRTMTRTPAELSPLKTLPKASLTGAKTRSTKHRWILVPTLSQSNTSIYSTIYLHTMMSHRAI